MRVIYIEWEDPTSIDEWVEVADLTDSPAVIKTIGWLIKEDEKNLYISLNYDVDSEVVSCVMIVPKRYVINRKDDAIITE